MIRPIGIAALALGIGLLVWGIQRANSFESNVSEFFTGSPTDQSMWLIIGGIAAIVLGGGLLFAGRGGSEA